MISRFILGQIAGRGSCAAGQDDGLYRYRQPPFDADHRALSAPPFVSVSAGLCVSLLVYAALILVTEPWGFQRQMGTALGASMVSFLLMRVPGAPAREALARDEVLLKRCDLPAVFAAESDEGNSARQLHFAGALGVVFSSTVLSPDPLLTVRERRGLSALWIPQLSA
jgi:hypothetical protein